VVCIGSDYHADSDRTMETILFQESLDPFLWKAKNPGRWNPGQQHLVLNGEPFSSNFAREVSLDQASYLVSPYGHAWIIPGAQRGKLKIEWKERETLFSYRIGITSVTPGKRMTKGTGVIAWLDHGPSRQVSGHHYFVLINSDGKSPLEFEAHVRQSTVNPGYQVLQQDSSAHAILFGEKEDNPLYSYVFHEGDNILALPYVVTVNKRLNLMFQEYESGHLVLSACDPHVDIESDQASENYQCSRNREIRIQFAPDLKPELISSTSGLPQTNPPLDARIENNTLIYTTRNAVTDTFKLTMSGKG